MLVKNWMSQNVISLDINDSKQQVNQLFVENRIRSLPVLENGRLVGIVTDRNLKNATVEDAPPGKRNVYCRVAQLEAYHTTSHLLKFREKPNPALF